MINIKNDAGAILYTVGADTLGGANLRDAYLGGANLRDAYLRDANLRGANLGGANLSGAYLRSANLSGVNLSGANLSGAYLRGANLRGANLRDANLRDAYLSGVNLSGVNLGGAVGIIFLGEDPRYYEFYAVQQEDGWRILAGCRWFTIQTAIAHWTRKGNKDALARVGRAVTLTT